MNVSTFNMYANSSDIDFNTFTIADAVDIAQFWEDVNCSDDIYLESDE